MADGSVYRRCSRRDENGKSLGDACPKLANKRHESVVLPHRVTEGRVGNRRPRRRGGYESATEAEEGLQRVRDLLGIAEDGDPETWARSGTCSRE